MFLFGHYQFLAPDVFLSARLRAFFLLAAAGLPAPPVGVPSLLLFFPRRSCHGCPGRQRRTPVNGHAVALALAGTLGRERPLFAF